MIPARHHHEWPTKKLSSDPRLAQRMVGDRAAGASLRLWRLAKLKVVSRGAAVVAERN